jgi:hypothetical protein
MNTQYIYDNSTTPPTQSVLQYGISPDTVFVSIGSQSMYANLTITVFNPTSQAVTCQMFEFGFHVGAEYGDLTTSATGIETISDQSAWTISKAATENPDDPTIYQFSAPSTGMADLELASNQSLTFHLDGILINSVLGEGGTPFLITEVTGANPANPNIVQGEITLTKAQPTLGIQQFTANPPTPINPGDPLTLNWKVTGSDLQQLYNTTTGALLYDSSKSTPPDATSYTDYPEQTTNYELIAWAGQLFTVQSASGMVKAPQFIGSAPYAKPSSVNAGQPTTLYWTTINADTVTITAPDFTTAQVQATLGQYTVSSVTAETTYQLTASAVGINTTDIKSVTVEVIFPPPSITSFTATPTLSNPDGSVNLAWETAYTSSAKLSQEVLGTSTKNDLGSVGTNQYEYPVNPSGFSRYTLLVYGEGGQAKATVIAAQQQTTAILGTLMNFRLIYDGANVWVANWNDGVIKIQPNGATVLGNYPSSHPSPIFTAGDLACIPNSNVVYVLSVNDCYVIKLQASDGSLLAAYPASNFVWSVNFPNGNCIAVDANYIWVSFYTEINPDPGNPNEPLQYNGAYVSQLSATDGSILGQYQIANANTQLIPNSINTDGSNVWITSPAGVIKMRASDGSILGTYLQGSGPQYATYDGSNLWVSCGDGTVKQLDANGNVLKSFQAGSRGDNMGRPVIAQGVVCVSAIHYDSNTGVTTSTLYLLQSSDGTVLGSYKLAPLFISQAFDGTCFWVLTWDTSVSNSTAIRV